MDIFHYECPKCEHQGSSVDLIHGYLCPCCKNNFHLANLRQQVVDDAIGQTNRAVYLISGYFCLTNERSMPA